MPAERLERRERAAARLAQELAGRTGAAQLPVAVGVHGAEGE
jgi:hypothetical protein